MLKVLKSLKKNFCIKEKIKKIPTLKEYMQSEKKSEKNQNIEKIYDLKGKTFSIKTFGCAMNFSDSEIIKQILETSKMEYIEEHEKANIILINTCAIRENAENKIWSLLDQYKNVKKKNYKQRVLTFIGLLGCMAERLKVKIVEEQKHVDMIVGPDSYKDLPRLINYLFSPLNQKWSNYAINTQLSIDETYADIIPIRKNKIKALVTIMRGCSNMCSFCIVPFVRGVERSRPLNSILEEIRQLRDQGIKEITLLGQNVNSYHYIEEEFGQDHSNTEGFRENYKTRLKKGLRFSGLLEILAQEAPQVRFRFTSPHPKDFPDNLLDVIQSNVNICKSLHIPLQSGNDSILEKMNRNYDIASYLKLIENVRLRIPKCGITTDIIVGFCGETENDFLDTFQVVGNVRFDNAFIYSYSEREKTLAHRKFQDDVKEEEKSRRLDEIVREFRRVLENKNKEEIGSYQLVLVEKKGKKKGQFSGKSELYKTVVFQNDNIKNEIKIIDDDIKNRIKKNNQDLSNEIENFEGDLNNENFVIGDFVEVFITDSTSQTLIGKFVGKSSIHEFMEKSKGEPFYFK